MDNKTKSEMNNEIDNETNNKSNNKLPSQPGRRPTYRWPGLESQALCEDPRSSQCYTRQQQLSLAAAEAAAREEVYGGEADLFNLKFDVGPDGPHTTIDFDKFNSNNGGAALVTTSDFVVYTKIKKLLSLGGGKEEENEKSNSNDNKEENNESAEIIDLKFSQTGKFVFFVTARVSMSLLKKVIQK